MLTTFWTGSRYLGILEPSLFLDWGRSMADWYVRHDGKIYGPMQAEKLRHLANAGKITPETDVRLGMDGKWAKARNVKGLFSQVVTVPKPPKPPTPPPIVVDPVQTQIITPPRLERGHAPHAPSVNVHLPRRTSSLGVASLVLGIVAFLFCWVPLIGILTIPVAALGLLLGGIGLVVAFLRRGSGIGYPIAGGVVSGMALAIGVAQVGAISATVSAVDEAMQQQSRTNQEVVGSTSSASTNDWASARSPVRQGNAEVKVASVRSATVKLKDSIAGEFDSEKPYLVIELEVANVSQSKKINYRTWQGADFSFSRDFASLTDNFDNLYKRIDFGFSTRIVGQTEADAIYPGKSIRDTLIFEPPIDSIQYLDLELPASNFGGQGMLRLRIPNDMIQGEL